MTEYTCRLLEAWIAWTGRSDASEPPPCIDTFLPSEGQDQERYAIFVELANADVEMRVNNTGIGVEYHFDRPTFGDRLRQDQQTALELIVQEYLCRRENGQIKTRADYGHFLERFPQFKDDLRSRCLPPFSDLSVPCPKEGCRGALEPSQFAKEGQFDCPCHQGPLTRLGRYLYDPKSPLGKGGFAIVYRGVDIEHGGLVAIKILREGLSSKARDRFIREAHLLADLRFPGIAPIHELGFSSDNTPYYTMKLVEGSDLAKWLKENRESKDDTEKLGIFEMICQIMADAHSKNICHRDLKPANVMIGTSSKDVHIMDWGLGKSLEDLGQDPSIGASQALQTGVLGTVCYMAPEQALGQRQLLNERTDVFGLGAILCEILTGYPLYQGDDESSLHERAKRADLTEALARLEGCGADRELLSLARACLAPDQESRPVNGAAVAALVANYQQEAQRQLEAAKIQAARADSERKRRRTLLALVASLLVLLAGAGAVAFWDQVNKARQDKQKAEIDSQDRVRKTELAIETKYRETEVATALDQESTMRKNLLGRLKNHESLHVLLNDFGDWQSILKARALILEKAEKLIRTNDGRINGELANNLRIQQGLLETDKKDLDWTKKLDELSVSQAYWDVNNRESGIKQYADLFAQMGLDAERGELGQLTNRLKESPIHLVQIASLDHWAVIANKRSQLLALSKKADPDPWRSHVRDAIGNKKKLQELAQYVAPYVDIRNQPPSFVWILALITDDKQDRCALLRRGLAYYPRDFRLNFTLAVSTENREESDAAIRTALAFRPDSPLLYGVLGFAMERVGDVESAVIFYEKHRALNPNDVTSHHRLAILSLQIEKEEYYDLIDMLQGLVNLGKGDPTTHVYLTMALAKNGEFAKASLHASNTLPLLSKDDKLGGPLEKLISECQERVEWENQLAAVLSNTNISQPRPAVELIKWADFCLLHKRYYVAAARFYSAALIRDDKLAACCRHSAARAALMAAAKKGRDKDALKTEEPIVFRKKGLEFLQTELKEYQKNLGKGGKTDIVRAALQSWRKDFAFASVRDLNELAKLPNSERKDWEKLWSDVKALLALLPAGGLDPTLEPTFGSAKLRAGFDPDPFTKELDAGGSVKTNKDGVKAFVGKGPSFLLDYQAGKGDLTIHVESKDDTTLLILSPDGTWVANDDRTPDDRNPLVRFAQPISGRYIIWVGTYGPSGASAILKITEKKVGN